MKVDLQDALLLVGLGTLTCGVWVIYWPGALIFIGLVCLFGVFLIERSKQKAFSESMEELEHRRGG